MTHLLVMLLIAGAAGASQLVGIPDLNQRCAIVDAVASAEGAVESAGRRVPIQSLVSGASSTTRSGQRVVLDVRWHVGAIAGATPVFGPNEKCVSDRFVLVQELGADQTARRRLVRIDLLLAKSPDVAGSDRRPREFNVWEADSAGPPKGWYAPAPFPVYWGSLVFDGQWKGKIEGMRRKQDDAGTPKAAPTKKNLRKPTL
jgi:hypothetical protein